MKLWVYPKYRAIPDFLGWGNIKRNDIFKEYFLNKGGGSGIPKLYVKFWWPIFLKNTNFLSASLTRYPMIFKTESGWALTRIPGSGLGLGTRWALLLL